MTRCPRTKLGRRRAARQRRQGHRFWTRAEVERVAKLAKRYEVLFGLPVLPAGHEESLFKTPGRFIGSDEWDELALNEAFPEANDILPVTQGSKRP